MGPLSQPAVGQARVAAQVPAGLDPQASPERTAQNIQYRIRLARSHRVLTDAESDCVRALGPLGLARTVPNVSRRLEGEMESKRFVDLFHDVGWNSSDPRTDSLNSY